MTELSLVARAARAAFQSGEDAILATVIRVGGSTYRRPGARMLLSETGWAAGSVSGGCLEGDILQKAWWRTRNGPTRVVYDSTQDDDEIEWGFGLGCDGTVEVLLERLDETCVAHLARLESWQNERVGGVLATTIHGRRLALDPIGDFCGDESLLDGARDALCARRSFWRDETFFEFVAPPQRLVVFGAGHDVVPVVRLASDFLGWHVIVVDRRSQTLRPERFSGASVVDDFPIENLEAVDAVVLMTHSFAADQALLPELLASRAGYLGLLGPRRRTERLLGERPFPDRLRAPLGLDIGADNPDEIAVALIAEIRAWLSGRDGRALTFREGPIH